MNQTILHACLFILSTGCIALLYSLIGVRSLLAHPSGNSTMQAIAGAIQEGAKAYLSRQYLSIAMVGALCFLGLWYGFSNPFIAWGFLIGAVLSGLSGYLGMMISVRSNVRVTQAAADHGLVKAFSLAFQSGAVTGFLVNGLGILGVIGYFMYLYSLDLSIRYFIESMIALGFGASLISIFARLGGGIFTKGADVGADLVGKVEAGIPEDDPRNPAVIADNVGDNVGDCAGMAADLFETYVVTLVAAVQMALFSLQGVLKTTVEANFNTLTLGSLQGNHLMTVLTPLMIGGICVLGGLVGVFFTRLKKSIMGAMYRGLFISMVVSVLGIELLVTQLNLSKDVLFASCIGFATTGLMVWITEYYTGFQYLPVKSIAKASVTGAGTNIIQGLAVSMEACFLPMVTVCIAILSSYMVGGLFGISIAATAMMALMGIIIAIDAYGPVTDNAGGIAEMAGLPPEVRTITDQLDAVGNTTKAVTKGYAIGSAALASIVLFSAYVQDASYYYALKQGIASVIFSFDLKDPFLVVGLLVGGVVPYLFGAMSMKAVGHAATSIVEEVRRQFREIKGIMQYTMGSSGEGKPDYGKAVDLLTKASIRTMMIPSLLPVGIPVATFIMARCLFGLSSAIVMLGGVLFGMIVTGFFLAVSMTSGGGAWDNAKKYIELGHHGGKGSAAHMAAVTGDTVGDPYKDTAGPAINPLIKIANLVALLLLASI